MKFPWHSRVACYRAVNDEWFEVCGEVEIIFVYETIPNLTVQSLKDLLPFVENLKGKLLDCPFLKLDNVAVSSNRVQDWNDEKMTCVPSNLNIELNNVYLDLFSGIDTYDDSQTSHQTVFCRTLCLPRFLHRNDILHLRKIRENIVEKQIEDWRIVEVKSNQIYCYKAKCMTCNHTLLIP